MTRDVWFIEWVYMDVDNYPTTSSRIDEYGLFEDETEARIKVWELNNRVERPNSRWDADYYMLAVADLHPRTFQEMP